MARQTNNSLIAHPDTRECLVRAALLCFARYGFDGTSIRQISAMAGKNSSLISYHFKSKEGLYRDVFRHLLTRFCVGTMDEWGLPQGKAPVGCEAGKVRLRELIERLLREVEAHFQAEDPLQDAAVSLLLSEIHAPREEIRDLLMERLEPSVREFRKCIRAIRPDLRGAEIDFWGITIQGACISHALRSQFNQLVWTDTDPDLPLETMANRLADFAFNGLVHT